MRQANGLGLTWNQVDLDRKVCWYHPDEMKAGNALGVALNDTAVEVLKRQIGKHKKFVFVNKWNKPISGINSRRPLQNSPKSPKFPPRHLGDFP